MTVGVKLDSTISEGGAIAAFFGSSLRGVQTQTTDVPNLPLAGEWGGKKVFSLAVQGSVEDGDTGKTISFEYSPDGTNSVKLDTTNTWTSSAIYGGGRQARQYDLGGRRDRCFLRLQPPRRSDADHRRAFVSWG